MAKKKELSKLTKCLIIATKDIDAAEDCCNNSYDHKPSIGKCKKKVGSPLDDKIYKLAGITKSSGLIGTKSKKKKPTKSKSSSKKSPITKTQCTVDWARKRAAENGGIIKILTTCGKKSFSDNAKCYRDNTTEIQINNCLSDLLEARKRKRGTNSPNFICLNEKKSDFFAAVRDGVSQERLNQLPPKFELEIQNLVDKAEKAGKSKMKAYSEWWAKNKMKECGIK